MRWRVLRLDDPRYDPAARLGWGVSRLDAIFEDLVRRWEAAAAEEKRIRDEAKARKRATRERLAKLQASRKGRKGRQAKETTHA